MLREYVRKLCDELGIETPKLNEQKIYPFRLGDEIVSLRDLNPGVAMQAAICLKPEKKKEELFIYLMRANLLGQGTGGARIGIDENEKFLTLSLGLPYEMNYQIFKDSFEDFVNYLIYWRDEVTKFCEQEQMY
jgi:hypothetical protein